MTFGTALASSQTRGGLMVREAPTKHIMKLLTLATVAVTRAQALLIVVGDPRVLSLDPIWRSFLNYVYLGGGWKGKKPDWDTGAPVDLNLTGYDGERRAQATADTDDMVARIQSMIITANDESYWNIANAADGASDDEHDDPSWRDDYQ
jgi:helicase MOV-10